MENFISHSSQEKKKIKPSSHSLEQAPCPLVINIWDGICTCTCCTCMHCMLIIHMCARPCPPPPVPWTVCMYMYTSLSPTHPQKAHGYWKLTCTMFIHRQLLQCRPMHTLYLYCVLVKYMHGLHVILVCMYMCTRPLPPPPPPVFWACFSF